MLECRRHFRRCSSYYSCAPVGHGMSFASAPPPRALGAVGDSCCYTMVLDHLNLSDNAGITDGAALVELVERRSSLRTVDVNGTSVGRASEEAIAAALRQRA